MSASGWNLSGGDKAVGVTSFALLRRGSRCAEVALAAQVRRHKEGLVASHARKLFCRKAHSIHPESLCQ